MHIVIAVLGILTAVYIFVLRARNAAEMTQELLGVADDVRAAARRLGFRRARAQHPMEAVEEPDIAAATVAAGYMELHGLPTQETRDTLLRSLQSAYGVDLGKAQELSVLGRWLMSECGGAQPAIARAAKKLYALGGRDVGPLLEVLKSISSDPLSDRQREALAEIRTAFRLR